MGRIVGVDLLELAINDTVRAWITRIWLSARPHLEALDIHAVAHPFVDRGSHSWDKQGKPDEIREKPRCQKQSTGEQDHRAMGKMFGRVL